MLYMYDVIHKFCTHRCSTEWRRFSRLCARSREHNMTNPSNKAKGRSVCNYMSSELNATCFIHFETTGLERLRAAVCVLCVLAYFKTFCTKKKLCTSCNAKTYTPPYITPTNMNRVIVVKGEKKRKKLDISTFLLGSSNTTLLVVSSVSTNSDLDLSGLDIGGEGVHTGLW